MKLRQWVLVGLGAISSACEPTERANHDQNAAAAGGGPQGSAEMSNPGSANAPNEPSNAGAGDAGANAPAQARLDGGPGGVGGGMGSPSRSDASTSGDAGPARAGSDAAARPDWEGLVTLDASVTKGPDGAVLSGGFPHYDAATAGPVLNAQAQAACLTLANNICGRSADCQISLAQLPATQRAQLVASCQDTFFRLHNCNRALSTASDFDTCAESVKSHDCMTVFANDFAVSCVNQITFQP